jgi:hypothetical protein
MARSAFASRASAACALLLAACGSDPARKQPAEPNEDPKPSDALNVEVSATRATYVDLARPAVVEIADAKSSLAWDLAFIGFDVLTNGGLSGPGDGWAFGPLPVSFFAFPDEPIDVPFRILDGAGSTFLGWYAYDGTTHTVYSRYHVYGLRSGGKLYKLQLLGYYGDVEGAPVSALYRLRYAEVTPDGVGETVELVDVNGTLDGEAAGPDVPGACLTLATGETALLSPNEAAESLAWDVCFRREALSVNGEIGGPGDVTGVNLDALAAETETLAKVKTRTAASELTRFDAVDHEALTAPGLEYRGDFVTSAFTSKWVDLSVNPPTPKPSVAFLVTGADGTSHYLVAFNGFEGADAEAPGTVRLATIPALIQ